MNIFITGSTGFIGKAFLEKLLQKKDLDVKKIFLLQREKVEYFDNRIEVLEGDLSKIVDYKDELLSSEYVYHIAANATFGSGIGYDSINFLPTQKIVDFLKISKLLKTFIYISTIGAVDRASNDRINFPLSAKSIPCPTSDYGSSKLKSEKYIALSGIPFTVIRPTWVYGRDMRFNSHINKFVSIINKSKWVAKLGFSGKVSLIHVEDLARSLVNCIDNKNVVNKTFFAETESLSLGEIFNEIYFGLYKSKLRQIKIPGFRLLFGYIHQYIPLLLSNLFVDYLCASDKFYKDFLLKDKKIIKFKHGVLDVIETNVDISGYWVVTGANSGIGYAIASILDKKGKKSLLIDKNTNNLFDSKNHFVLECDLSNVDELSKIIDSLKDKKIFCLINNAGIGLKKELFDLSSEEVDLMLNVNIRAPLLLSVLLKKNLVSNHSTIVNIGSSAGYNPLPGMSLYTATKAFIINVTRSFIGENDDGRNKIILFSPSGTVTNFQKNAGVLSNPEKQGLLDPNDVAMEIIRSVEKGKSSERVLGVKSKILILISKFLPVIFNIKLQGFLFKKLR